MNCTIELHVELSQNCINCPFCNHQISDYHTDKQSNCCPQPDITEDYSRLLCINCGQITGDLFKNNYIDVYENMYKIRKKSVYIRKYHIINVLNEIGLSNKKPIPSFVFNNVLKMFDKIKNILPQINEQHKRIISVKCIIHRLFLE